MKQKASPADVPVYLFKQGNNFESQRFFGAHFENVGETEGVMFRVWAPRAKAVSVVGDFNSWIPSATPMKNIDPQGGIWERFVPGIRQFDIYKYCVTTPADELVFKADPYAFHAETRPANCSKVYALEDCYNWTDDAWQKRAAARDPLDRPMNIYEMHAGSWRTYPDGNPFDYRALAPGACSLPDGHGLYPRGADAPDGISFRRELGLSGDGLFRPHQPLRHAGGFQGICG